MKTCCMMVAGPFEKDYWREWAKWHHSLGFDDIVIVTNNWKLDRDSSMPYVKSARLDGQKTQLKTYNQFAFDCIREYDWAMILDGDEFLHVPLDIKTYFKEAENEGFPQVSFQWMLFGDGGPGVPESGSVVQRFQRASGVFKMEVKSAISFKWCREHKLMPHWVNPHFACAGFQWLPSLHYPLRQGIVGPTVKQLEGAKVDPTQPYIAHYFAKTKAEWATRRGLPRPDSGQLRDPKEFDEHNHNEVAWPYLAQVQSK